MTMPIDAHSDLSPGAGGRFCLLSNPRARTSRQYLPGQSLGTRSRWGLPALLCMSLVGCGKGVVPVAGVVTLDGQPVPAATVLFMPEEGNGRAASALTDDEGNFRLTTYVEGDGALPGQYHVVVSKTEAVPEPPALLQPGEEKKVIGHYRAFKKEGRKKSVLPADYGNESTSPLKCRVPTDGKLVLELKGAAAH